MEETEYKQLLSLLSTKLGKEYSDITHDSEMELTEYDKLREWLYIRLERDLSDSTSLSPKLFSLKDDVSVSISPQQMIAEIQVRKTVWQGPHNPVPTLFPTIIMDLENLDLSNAVDLIYKAAKAVRRSRRNSFQKCRFCGERTAPEHMYERGACQGCATEHWKVVY